MILNSKILKDISHKNDLRKQEEEDFIEKNVFRSVDYEWQLCMENKNLWTREFLCMTYGDFMSKYCHIGAVFLHPWKPWLFVHRPQPANHYSNNLESLPLHTGESYRKEDVENHYLFDEPKLTMPDGGSLDDLEVRHLNTYVYKGNPRKEKTLIGEGLNHRWEAHLEYSFRLCFENVKWDAKAMRRIHEKNPLYEFIWEKVMGYSTGISREYARRWDDWFQSECRKKGYHSRSVSHYLESFRYGRRYESCYILNEEAIKIIQKKFKDLPKKMLSIDYNDEKKQKEVIAYNKEQERKVQKLQKEVLLQKKKMEQIKELEKNKEQESWEEVECEDYLYLMKNNINSLYKIGVSNNPSHRERTLQSQEPEVNLIAKFKGLAHLEREWHNYFSSERMRGEWFKLNSTQLNFMISKCKSSKAPPIRKQEAELK